jgi:hypothetical protein
MIGENRTDLWEGDIVADSELAEMVDYPKELYTVRVVEVIDVFLPAFGHR